MEHQWVHLIHAGMLSGLTSMPAGKDVWVGGWVGVSRQQATRDKQCSL